MSRKPGAETSFYAVNTRSPIFGELRSICMNSFGLASVVSRELELFRDRVELAFLYGSVVRGDDRPDSDIDLVIVGGLDVFDLATAIETIRNAISWEIDLTLYTPSEWEALGKDRVVRSIHDGKKIVLIG
ncbi:nucleotidyltransferase domain-containing protein [Rhizobium sp. 21-4511-3d]